MELPHVPEGSVQKMTLLRQTSDFLNRHRYWFGLGITVLLAVAFRFWRLDQLPPGLHPDEAANGLDIFRILEQSDWRPLYNTNGPRESLFFFLQAIPVAIIGNTILALRIAPAVIGTLAVIVSYFWAKQWFGPRVALLTAFLMAVTPWAVTMSRIGFRASMVPLFIPLVLLLYTKAFQTKRTLWFVLAGAALGTGMYTYLSFRLFPLVLLAALGYLMIWRRSFIAPYYRLILTSVIGFLIVLVPMAIFGIAHPEEISGRAGGTSFMNPDLNDGNPVGTLVDTIIKTALMFNVRGDENFRHNLGGQPMLNFFVGIMFITGLIISVLRMRQLKYFALLAVFGVMLLPEVLTAEGIPHALRAIGVMPAVFTLAAIGINYWLQIWYATFPVNRAARASGLLMICLPLAATLYQGYNQYFVAWAGAPETYEAYSEDAVAVANYLNTANLQPTPLVLIDGYSDKTVEYITHKHSTYRRIEISDIEKIDPAATKYIVIGRNYKDAALQKLKAKFPKASLTSHRSKFNDAELFSVYEIKS
jgi:hypothetical protein